MSDTPQFTLTEAGLDVRQGQPADLILRRATLLDPVAGLDGVYDLVVREGEIAALAEPGEAEEWEGAEVIDAEGLHAFPAFFDPHVHLRTPGQEHKEDLETGTRAAAAGGFCGVIAMANTSPPVSRVADVIALRERARSEASIPVGFLATVTVDMAGGDLTEMAGLRQAGALGFSDDGLPIRDAGIMRRALQYQRMCGGPIALHQEDPGLSGNGVMHEGEVSALLGLAGVPAVSERVMVERDLALAEYEGGQIHIQHLSARSAVERRWAMLTTVRPVARRSSAPVSGVEVADAVQVEINPRFALSAEASPHHLCLNDEEVRSLDPMVHKMNPPLRAEGDRLALIEALRDGTIDCIATDHAPHADEDKQVPYEQAAMGVTGLEVAFAALHTELVLPGVISLALLVERLAGGAEPFGVPRPSLSPGSEANIALCDLSLAWVAGADGYESRSRNCWADGRRLTGRPVVTLAAGQVAYRLRSFSMGVAA